MTSDKKILALLGTGSAVALIVVAVVASIAFGGRSQDNDTPPTATVTVTETTVADLDEFLDEEEAVEPGGPASSFGDGTYEVGVDVRPGRYRNAGDTYDGAAPCVAYTTREPNDINTFVKGSTTSGPGILTVDRGLYLTVQGCQEWTREQR